MQPSQGPLWPLVPSSATPFSLTSLGTQGFILLKMLPSLEPWWPVTGWVISGPQD